MSLSKINHTKLINCILYRGGGIPLLKALKSKGILTANLFHARGSAIGDPVGHDGLPMQFAKEIISVVVEEQRADEIFEFIFEFAQIDRPHGGFMTMTSLKYSNPFELPAGVAEEVGE